MNQAQLQAFVKNAVINMENASPSADPYKSIVSTGNSQLSFGAMQLDVGSGNAIAVNAFTQIMNTRVGVDGKTQSDINDLIQKAKTDASHLNQEQRNFIDAALAANTTIVDQADAQQLAKVMGYINSALAAAASNSNGPGELNQTAPDPQFITELASWGNRTGGLSETCAFLKTASNISQSVYESQYLSQQWQFTNPLGNETIESNAQRVADATNAALKAIGATVTSFYLAPHEANSIGFNGSNVEFSSGPSYLSIYKDSSGSAFGTLWSFLTPGSNTVAGLDSGIIGDRPRFLVTCRQAITEETACLAAPACPSPAFPGTSSSAATTAPSASMPRKITSSISTTSKNLPPNSAAPFIPMC